MNAARRKEITRALNLITEAVGILEECGQDEQAYYDAMPESIQAGERGDAAQAAASALEDFANGIDTSEIEEACGVSA